MFFDRLQGVDLFRVEAVNLFFNVGNELIH